MPCTGVWLCCVQCRWNPAHPRAFTAARVPRAQSSVASKVMQFQGKVPEQALDQMFGQMIQQALAADDQKVRLCGVRLRLGFAAPRSRRW